MLKLDGVETLVFDLGGVIIDIDFQQTFIQFSKLSGKSTEEIKKQLLDSGLLLQYEKGLSTDAEFVNSIRSVLSLTCDDREIENAFLALLLNIPPERVVLLRTLATKYRLFLLSNTNAIHYRAVNAILYRDTACMHLDELFETVFLSYEMGLVKPGIEIYKELIKLTGVNPASTLFLDDNEANLLGAASAGLRTVLVSPEASIIRLFNHE